MDALAPNAEVVQLLSAMLDHDFPGATPLREQLRGLTVRPSCSCGCGTLELVQPGVVTKSTATSPIPVEGLVRDELGAEVGGLLLFVADGVVSSLEIYSYDEPLAMPHPSRVEWFVRPPR